MIRVKIDLVPFGNEQRAKQIGELILANIGNVGLGVCEYEAVMYTDNQPPVYKRVSHWRQDGFYTLIEKLIEADEVPQSITHKALCEKITMAD